MNVLGLRGLIHLWGDAGAGKTLLAAALAGDVSKVGHVEWINTNAKMSFVDQIKRNVEFYGGRMDNIAVTITENHKELCSIIESLPDTTSDTSLIVIDPITRVIDMTHSDSTLWCRELIEIVLPTLAGVVFQKETDIIVISENRMLEDSENHAVLHQSISRWIDHDLHLVRSPGTADSQILTSSQDCTEALATMRTDDRGIAEIIPRMVFTSVSKGESELVR
jgi:hypothetical protein